MKGQRIGNSDPAPPKRWTERQNQDQDYRKRADEQETKRVGNKTTEPRLPKAATATGLDKRRKKR